jgi:hypothetical protein
MEHAAGGTQQIDVARQMDVTVHSPLETDAVDTAAPLLPDAGHDGTSLAATQQQLGSLLTGSVSLGEEVGAKACTPFSARRSA